MTSQSDIKKLAEQLRGHQRLPEAAHAILYRHYPCSPDGLP